MTGIERIAAERKRIRIPEGLIPPFDDYWKKNEIIEFALYLINEPSSDSRIRNLEKAGALIAAEIDRLLRMDMTRRMNRS
jgi:hypothetical protein